ncbi:MAG TPA: thioesterase family protein [Roseimicrobium sp.]|nr:thioesterase family protein [Roseimicrobium sp.]
MSHQVFTHRHRVSYAECTVGNHVYYSRYLDILEVARGEFFRSLGQSFLSLQGEGITFPAIDVQLLYRGAARYDDELSIEVWLTEIRKVRMTFAYRVLGPSGTPLIMASTSHACTSLEDKLIALPPMLVERLNPFLKPSDPAA